VDTEHQQRIADLEAQVASGNARIAEQDARIAELTTLVAVLEKKIAVLLVEQGRNSSNSNLPPSSDSPADRAKKNAQKQDAKKGKRKRGGQPKHRGTSRALLPPDKVDDVVDFFPTHCEHCAASLPETRDEQPLRFQLTELPAFEPHTTEFRRHTVTCSCCRRPTTAPHDAARIPASPFGPRLTGTSAVRFPCDQWLRTFLGEAAELEDEQPSFVSDLPRVDCADGVGESRHVFGLPGVGADLEAAAGLGGADCDGESDELLDEGAPLEPESAEVLAQHELDEHAEVEFEAGHDAVAPRIALVDGPWHRFERLLLGRVFRHLCIGLFCRCLAYGSAFQERAWKKLREFG